MRTWVAFFCILTALTAAAPLLELPTTPEPDSEQCNDCVQVFGKLKELHPDLDNVTLEQFEESVKTVCSAEDSEICRRLEKGHGIFGYLKDIAGAIDPAKDCWLFLDCPRPPLGLEDEQETTESFPTLPTLPPFPSFPTLPPFPSVPTLDPFPSLPTLEPIPSLPTLPPFPSVPTLPPFPSVPTLPPLPTDPAQAQDVSIPTLPTLPPVPSFPTLPPLPTLGPFPSLPTLPPFPSVPTLPPFPSVPTLPPRPTENPEA